VKIIVQLARFFAAVVFLKNSQNPRIAYTFGTIAVLCGVFEALLGFWKEVAARVHEAGQPRYHDRL
jgi:hypothetical protein